MRHIVAPRIFFAQNEVLKPEVNENWTIVLLSMKEVS